jgi:alkylation response protein AidB-like acyl-CoA dehydrogenase
MDATPTDQLIDFRLTVRDWLLGNRPTDPFGPLDTDEGMASRLAWERLLFDNGYAAVSWPVQHGGRGLGPWEELVFDEEYAELGLPKRLNHVGLSLAGPTFMAHGTQEQLDCWLPAILTCKDIWCQGFSEPGAGSDLAALRTRGDIDGDVIVVNGQKIWTTTGIVANKMIALVRTGPGIQKHQGITFIVVDLDLPGIDVRPLIQLHRESGFAEIFFDDVRVPLRNVIGRVDDGWRVAMTTLSVERGVSHGDHARVRRSLDAVLRLASGADCSDATRERLGALRARYYAYLQMTYRITGLLARGQDLGAAGNISKLIWSELQTAIGEERLLLLGGEGEVLPDGHLDDPFPSAPRDYWHARASQIFAGTNQIQKNVIAERGLGLPRQ